MSSDRGTVRVAIPGPANHGDVRFGSPSLAEDDRLLLADRPVAGEEPTQGLGQAPYREIVAFVSRHLVDEESPE